MRGVAFEKAVRRKPLARRTRALCKLNGASEGCRSSRESSGPVEEEPAHRCKDESMAAVSPSRLGTMSRLMCLIVHGPEVTLPHNLLKIMVGAIGFEPMTSTV